MGTLPLVSDNPLVLQATTGDWPEFQKFKLPINYDLLTSIADVRLWLETGTEPEVQGLLKDNTDNSTFLVWNTTFDLPGQHFLQPRIYLKAAPDEAKVAEAAGPPLPFQTDNALQFEGLYSAFDSSGAILYAQTYPGTAYTIELRDMNGVHLKTIAGVVTTDPPEIDEQWDLTRDDMTPFTGDLFTAAFTVTPPSSPPQTRVFPASRSSLGFGEGLFSVAYRWGILSDGNPSSGKGKPLDQCIQQGVVDVLLTPGAQNPHNYSSFFNDFTPIHPNYNLYGGAGYIANQDRASALLDDLAEPASPRRNFFWYGHGKPVRIGFEPDVNIWASDVASRLGNNSEFILPPDTPPVFVKNCNHPYRFVLIDGCDAGATDIWPGAFGIPGKTIGYNQIRNHPERAQAFLGFTKEVFSQNTAVGFDWYRRTLFVFFSLWMQGNTRLQECFDVAGDKGKLADYLHNIFGDNIPTENVMQMGRWVNDPYNATTFTKINRIYGYPFMTRDGVVQPP